MARNFVGRLRRHSRDERSRLADSFRAAVSDGDRRRLPFPRASGIFHAPDENHARLRRAALEGVADWFVSFRATFWTGVTLLFFLSNIHFFMTLAFLAVIFCLGFAKAWLRLTAVKLVLKDYEKKLNRQFLPHLTLWTISPILYFYNCACALFRGKSSGAASSMN
jgi:hypothetical protein